jgi:hypothetical protein
MDTYHQSYKWQPLGGGHSALDDCRAALATLREMAQVEQHTASDGGGG